MRIPYFRIMYMVVVSAGVAAVAEAAVSVFSTNHLWQGGFAAVAFAATVFKFMTDKDYFH